MGWLQVLREQALNVPVAVVLEHQPPIAMYKAELKWALEEARVGREIKLAAMAPLIKAVAVAVAAMPGTEVAMADLE